LTKTDIINYSVTLLKEQGIRKLRAFGFVNVSQENLLTDEVYVYHFKKYILSLPVESEEMKNSIRIIIKMLEDDGPGRLI
jgi:hypothetical protein